MLNRLVRTIYTMVTLSFGTAMFMPSICYANSWDEEVDLICCTEGPTQDGSEGRPEIKKTASIMGVRMIDEMKFPESLQVHNSIKDVIILNHFPGFDEWRQRVAAEFGKGSPEDKKIFKASLASISIDMEAKCTGTNNWVDISKPGTSISCCVGEGIEFRQEGPECSVEQVETTTIVKVTNTKAETLDELMIRFAKEKKEKGSRLDTEYVNQELDRNGIERMAYVERVKAELRELKEQHETYCKPPIFKTT